MVNKDFHKILLYIKHTHKR